MKKRKFIHISEQSKGIGRELELGNWNISRYKTVSKELAIRYKEKDKGRVVTFFSGGENFGVMLGKTKGKEYSQEFFEFKTIGKAFNKIEILMVGINIGVI